MNTAIPTRHFVRSSKGCKRIAVDPQGNPWIVDFSGNIFRAVNGSFQQMPRLARDIGIGGNGAAWVIGSALYCRTQRLRFL